MKKKGPVIIIIIIVAIFFVLGLCGVGGYFIYTKVIKKAKDTVGDKIGEELLEEAIESGTGSDVNIDSDDESVSIESDDMSMNIEEGQDWPEDIPSTVPEFTYGTILGVTQSLNQEEDYWAITIQDIDSNAFTNYKSDLEDNGWEIDYTQTYNEVEALSASLDNDTVVLTIATEENTATMSISIMN